MNGKDNCVVKRVVCRCVPSTCDTRAALSRTPLKNPQPPNLTRRPPSTDHFSSRMLSCKGCHVCSHLYPFRNNLAGNGHLRSCRRYSHLWHTHGALRSPKNSSGNRQAVAADSRYRRHPETSAGRHQPLGETAAIRLLATDSDAGWYDALG